MINHLDTSCIFIIITIWLRRQAIIVYIMLPLA